MSWKKITVGIRNNDYLVGLRPGGNLPTKPVETFGEGRICAAPDCNTILSRFNNGKLCGIHESESTKTKTPVNANQKISIEDYGSCFSCNRRLTEQEFGKLDGACSICFDRHEKARVNSEQQQLAETQD